MDGKEFGGGLSCHGRGSCRLSGEGDVWCIASVIVSLTCVIAIVIEGRLPSYKLVSSLYYRLLSSVFVPRFVKGAVWTLTDTEWTDLNGGGFFARTASSVGESVGSTGEIRSFRIPDGQLLKQRSPIMAWKRGGTQSVDSFPVRDRIKTHDSMRGSMDIDSAMAPSPQYSPSSARRRVHRKRHGQWQPVMLRITSGQELDSMCSHMKAADRLKTDFGSEDSARLGEGAECPLSPASSVDSNSSFSRSVSEYVDSWLQTLRSGKATHSAEGTSSLKRGSLDGHGAHRHYTHGAVKARSSAAAALEKYAIASQLQAKNSMSLPGMPGRISLSRSDGSHTSALDSLGLDGECPEYIRENVTDEHLLQLGDILGEDPCASVLDSLNIPKAFDDEESLFGLFDENSDEHAWENVVSQKKQGLWLNAWRMPLRNGYYVYKSHAFIEGLEPQDVRPFHLDDQARSLWDQSAVAVERELPPGSTRISRHAESCLHRYISKFPMPLSARSYEYCRRVWTRPCDGGCYAISKSCPLPSETSSKYVKVKEYISGCIIRAAPGGTEILTAYFEDSQVRPGLAKMGVPKGLWPFWVKYEASIRLFASAKRANHSRRSLDLSDTEGAIPEDQRIYAGPSDGSSEYDSDDEVYDVLARLKAKRSRNKGATLNPAARWARRILVAGAIKVLHESMTS